MTNDVSFARKVKEELASQEYSKEQEKYILSGFCRNGAIITLGQIPSLTLKSKLAQTARLIYTCLKDCYALDPTIYYDKTSKFGKGITYIVTVEDKKLYDIIEDLEIFSDNGYSRITPKEGLKNKNFRFLLIGSFLANGSVNNPSSNKTSYFLEMAFTDKKDALAIKRKLNSFKEEKTMNFKYIQRRDKHVIYLKKSDQISVFLSYIGAVESMFDFENARILKEDININNRFTICDAANFSKTLNSAKRDIDDINLVLKTKPLSLFDQKTQEVINARLSLPESNYREIAEYITNNKNIQITKSGVVHILSSLREEAKKIKEKDKN